MTHPRKVRQKTGKGVQALHQGNTTLHSQGSYFSLPLIYSQKSCSGCCHVWKYTDTCSHCQSMNAAAMQWTNTHHLFQEYISIPALMHALIQHLGQQRRILVLQKGNISCPKRQIERKSSSSSQLIGWATGKRLDFTKKVFRRAMEKLGVGFLSANHSALIAKLAILGLYIDFIWWAKFWQFVHQWSSCSKLPSAQGRQYNSNHGLLEGPSHKVYWKFGI